jgi:protoporphyrinogen oxidase
VPQRSVDVAIVGSGPCGLGAAWRIEALRSEGASTNYVVIDEKASPGGSADSVTTPEGFTFDYGNHVLYPHEHYSNFTQLMDSLVPSWHESAPVRGVWIDDRIVPYPVQQNIHRFPLRKLLPSLAGLSTAYVRGAISSKSPSKRRDNDLESHLRRSFGNGLTDLVLGPLNRKMWAHEPRSIDDCWTGQRSGSGTPNVANAAIGPVLRSLITRRDNVGWTPASRIRYPTRGGSGVIWRNLARRLPAERIVNGRRVVEIDARAKVLVLDNRETIAYEHVISSMPLDSLLRMCSGVNGSRELGPALRFSQAYFVGLGIAGAPPERLANVHSFHIPQPDIPCWRICIPSNFSPGNVPSADHWSLLCEISDASTTPFELESAAAAIETKLVELGILAHRDRVVSRWQAALWHGYPVPFLGRDRILHTIQTELGALGVFSRGRFGGWKYEVSNQDHTFMQGVEAVDAILCGKPETTYAHPEWVNE